MIPAVAIGVESMFRPFRADPPLHCHSQGVALGWYVIAPSALRTEVPIAQVLVFRAVHESHSGHEPLAVVHGAISRRWRASPGGENAFRRTPLVLSLIHI